MEFVIHSSERPQVCGCSRCGQDFNEKDKNFMSLKDVGMVDGGDPYFLPALFLCGPCKEDFFLFWEQGQTEQDT